MSTEKVREYLKPYGFANRVRELDVSSATVDLAAAAIGCEPCRIAKSITFKVGDSAVLVVAAGDAKVDNSKFKAQFHTKATMLKPDEAVSMVGHAVGGVCPFAVNEGVKIYLDESLRRFESVFPAAGDSNSVLELSIPELESCTPNEGWIDVCKGWSE